MANVENDGGVRFIPPDPLFEPIVIKNPPISQQAVDEAFRYRPLSLQAGESLVSEQDSLLSTSGKVLFTAPNPELIDALHQADPRIEYFPYQLDPEAQKHLDEAGRLDMPSIGEPAFYRYVGIPLAAKVAKDFPDQQVLPARGIACSINGPLYDGDSFLIRDVRHVVNIGDEQGRDSTLMAGVGLFPNTDTPDIHYRVSQYMFGGPSSLSERLPESAGQSIFPVLLVYDKSKIEPLIRYGYKLPENPEERASAILKAYIVPRPE